MRVNRNFVLTKYVLNENDCMLHDVITHGLLRDDSDVPRQQGNSQRAR